MVVFLAPDSRRLDELAEATRDYLAWDWISHRVEELNVSPQQVSLVGANRSRSDQAVAARIAQAYHWALVPEQPDPARPPVISVEKADGATERLADRVSDRLKRAGLLADAIAARTIRLDLDQRLGSVWGRGHISVGELWGYYCRYPYLMRLRDRSVLEDGIRSTTWEAEGFALGHRPVLPRLPRASCSQMPPMMTARGLGRVSSIRPRWVRRQFAEGAGFVRVFEDVPRRAEFGEHDDFRPGCCGLADRSLCGCAVGGRVTHRQFELAACHGHLGWRHRYPFSAVHQRRSKL